MLIERKHAKLIEVGLYSIVNNQVLIEGFKKYDCSNMK